MAALLQGRSGEAVEPLRNAARLLPGDAEAHGDLGSALLATGLPGEAAEASCSGQSPCSRDSRRAHRGWAMPCSR